MIIGIMGGTFNPIHRGHLEIAEEARKELNMAEVIFVPAGQPYFKDMASISPAEHRVNMVKLAISGRPYFQISLIEIERDGPTFAIDTISQLKAKYGHSDEIYYIMGWDSVMSLPRWQEPEKLIALCKIVAAPRPGYPKPDIFALEKDLEGISSRTIVMDRPEVNVSATVIRQRVRDGLSIDHLVTKDVADYIRQHKLYLNQA